MALYRYVKAAPILARRRRRLPMIASLTLIGIGGVLLTWVVWPILSFSIVNSDFYRSTVTPIQDTGSTVAKAAPVVFAAGNPLTGTTQLSNPNAWFPTLPQKKVVTPVNTYTMSIPKLKIVDADVTISGDDLDYSLVHYGGTALPGDYGNTVIFGHSTLPQFYDPKNYRTIFSLLPTLKPGDEIDVTYDGISYRYTVYDLTVAPPSDLSALEQRFDDSYLTLVTCVPPGTLWERLHVMARLDRMQQ